MKKMSHNIWEESKVKMSTTWGTNWDNYRVADHNIITLYSSPCCILEVLIVTYRLLLVALIIEQNLSLRDLEVFKSLVV